MRRITLPQPEALDAVCSRVYGGESGYVEAVLRANPGLAAAGRRLPAGTKIDLPEIELPAADDVPVVTLWD